MYKIIYDHHKVTVKVKKGDVTPAFEFSSGMRTTNYPKLDYSSAIKSKDLDTHSILST